MPRYLTSGGTRPYPMKAIRDVAGAVSNAITDETVILVSTLPSESFNVAGILTNTLSTDASAEQVAEARERPAASLVQSLSGQHAVARILREYLVTNLRAPAFAWNNGVPIANVAEYTPRKVDVAEATAFSNAGDIRYGKSTVNLFPRVLDYLERFSPTGYGVQVATRLGQLARDFEDDTDGQSELSLNSVCHFASFIEKHRLKRPTLSATPVGQIIAQWRGDDKLLSVVFFSDGAVKYFISSPNPNHPEKRDRQTGITTWDALYDAAKLESHNWLRQ